MSNNVVIVIILFYSYTVQIQRYLIKGSLLEKSVYCVEVMCIEIVTHLSCGTSRYNGEFINQPDTAKHTRSNSHCIITICSQDYTHSTDYTSTYSH